MYKTIFLFLFILSTSLCYSQNIFLCYEPIKADIKMDKWDNIDAHLDTMYSKYSDSILVPFTLFQLGTTLYEKQDFEKLYKYSKKMLQYDYENLETKFPKSSRTKWDWYCEYLPTQKVYHYGNFYIASSYLNRKQYDSCLFHLDSSFIENFISLPRNYTYNLSVGLHKTMIRSFCYEAKGEIEKARKLLIPYLFLDNIPETNNFYNHLDIINQYFKLVKMSNLKMLPSYDKKKLFLIEDKSLITKSGFPIRKYTDSNDSIIKPSGWVNYNSSNAGNYILIEDRYVPIYINIHQYFDTPEKYENHTLKTI